MISGPIFVLARAEPGRAAGGKLIINRSEILSQKWPGFSSRQTVSSEHTQTGPETETLTETLTGGY